MYFYCTVIGSFAKKKVQSARVASARTYMVERTTATALSHAHTHARTRRRRRRRRPWGTLQGAVGGPTIGGGGGATATSH